MMKIIIKNADPEDYSREEDIISAAELVYVSNPEFYGQVSPNRSDLMLNISEQIKDPHSELGSALLARFEDGIVGISVYYPSEEMRQRQLISFKYLLRVPSAYADAIDRIQVYSAGIEPLSFPRYMYWARLGVSSHLRGLGIATMLNIAMEYDVKKRGYDQICSHLSRDNKISSKMHEGRRFTRVSDQGYAFIAMSKILR